MKTQRFCFQTVTLALAAGLVYSVGQPSLSAQTKDVAPVHSAYVESTRGVVASDHPLASELGAQTLARGGNAADAGVTAMLALGVLNPFASGLGGGGFCLYRPIETGETTVLDFREVAPQAAHRDVYIIDGQAQPALARRGGWAVGVPGEAGGLWSLHGRFGALPWEQVVEPAHRIAQDGFDVGKMLTEHLTNMSEELAGHAELTARFRAADGSWLQPGDRAFAPALARTLRILMEQGSAPFYSGEVAGAIVEAVNKAGGQFVDQDMLNYRVVPREPIVGTYRGLEIIGMPPPSSGAIALLEVLNILEGDDLAKLGWSAPAVHLITEALKHAFADRAHLIGDPDFVEVPTERLISAEHAAMLRARILDDAVLPFDQYGTSRPNDEIGGTSHLSIIDAQGNMLACTTTVNGRFGAMVYVPEYGIVLNNEMADFNVEPGTPNMWGLVGSEQNTVQPGKRPLSSMSPTLVLKDGQPYMSLGASGGPTIITGTLFALLHLVDFGRTPSEAVTFTRLHHQWLPNQLFVEFDNEPWIEALRAKGHDVVPRRAFNSVQLVVRNAEGLFVGVSDHRKYGEPKAPVEQSSK
ncbi:MAG: gamma-glutamyltransferase [Bradymonadaceae bacterium]|nr:gamma-glutamyltransferase [Lujinxingiaceae bacterium]